MVLTDVVVVVDVAVVGTALVEELEYVTELMPGKPGRTAGRDE